MIPIVILAAGASTRMGRPKQLLTYQGQTLLQHVIDKALPLGQPIIVVLGAHADRIAPTLVDKPVTVVQNDHWALGMSSTIQVGLKKAMNLYPDLSALMILLVDQPYLSQTYLESLYHTYLKGDYALVASRYAERVGVPAVFSADLFEDLLKLSGQEGARFLIQKFKESLLALDFPKGALDLDTPEDWVKWLEKQ